MLEGFSNASRIPELRRRLLFTAAMLAVYRIGVAVPTPGIDGQALASFFDQARSTLFGWINLFSGGALERFSVFALGIMPYISVAIILDLMKIASPYLDELYKEGEAGRRKISQYTRYGTVGLALLQGTMIAISLEKISSPNGGSVVYYPGWGFRILTVMTLTAGTIFIMWLGEQITERGIGNGISLIIMAGIVARLPSAIGTTVQFVREGEMSVFLLIFILAVALGVVAGIVYIETSQRRIPVQYARRIQGRRMYGGQTSHLPLKINTSGVIPPIFASSILVFPATLATFVPGLKEYSTFLTPGGPIYDLVYVALIIFFCYFYTAVTFNPVERCGQSQEVWRIHSRHPSGTFYGRIYRPGAFANHARRRDLRERRMRAADDPDPALQRAVLLWRHRAADCGGRGDRYDRTNRDPSADPQLRGLHEAGAGKVEERVSGAPRDARSSHGWEGHSGASADAKAQGTARRQRRPAA